MIYFDNAATSGHKPQSVINAVEYALKNLSANPGRSGHTAALRAADAVYNARKRVSDFFGGGGEENVVFTLNCTQSLNFVIKGVLKKGDHAVISSLEHNAVMRPLTKMGTDFDIATVKQSQNDTVREFEQKIKPNTKLVIMTAASNVTGQILPFREIAKICHKRGIYFCLDAAQGAGILSINMQEMHIDYLCVAPHKSLYAPMGIGVLICRSPIYNTVIEGGTGTASLEFSQPDSLPEMLESGTLNLPGIVGLAEGIAFINKVGMEKIYKHEIKLSRMLYDGLLKNDKIILYTDPPSLHNYAPVLPFNVKGVTSDKANEYFSQNNVALRSGLHCAPTAHKMLGTQSHGTLRASFSAFNTEAEVQNLLKLAKNL